MKNPPEKPELTTSVVLLGFTAPWAFIYAVDYFNGELTEQKDLYKLLIFWTATIGFGIRVWWEKKVKKQS